MDKRIKLETNNGQKILRLDFSDLDREDFFDALEKSHQIICTHGDDDLIVLADIHNVVFDRKTAKMFQKHSEKSRRFIKVAAFYRVNTIQRMAISAIGKLTDREFHFLNSEEDLVSWFNARLN